MLCPYCNSSNTHDYSSLRIPLFTWPLPKGLEIVNPEILTTQTLCHDCFYAFNSTPASEVDLKLLFDNYLHNDPLKGVGEAFYDTFLSFVEGRLAKTDFVVDVGCSNGYVLNILHMQGFERLMGIDPSPNIPKDFPIEVRKAYFTKETRFKEPVDVFLIQQVLDILSKPWELLECMSRQLSIRGKILAEFSHYCAGVFHQRSSWFTPVFLQTMAERAGLTLQDYRERDGIIQVEFRKDKKAIPFFSRQELEEKKKEILKNTGAFQKKVEASQRELSSAINAFVREAGDKPIYWWGSGQTATKLYLSIAPELRTAMNLTVLDSDLRREGLLFVPANVSVCFAPPLLRGKTISYLVLASAVPDEMKEQLKAMRCEAEHVFTLAEAIL